jgi:hypothetical protein
LADPGFHLISLWALTLSIQAVKTNKTVSETSLVHLITNLQIKDFTNTIQGYMILSSSFHNLRQQEIKEVVLNSTRSRQTEKR